MVRNSAGGSGRERDEENSPAQGSSRRLESRTEHDLNNVGDFFGA